MNITFVLYTIGSPNIGELRIVRGVDQRFGRLDIVARVIDVLLDDMFKEFNKNLIVFIESIEMAIYLDIDMINRKFYREFELYDVVLRCINSNQIFCSRIKIDFKLLMEMLQARGKIAVLSEEGNRISLEKIDVNTIYVIGAEVDPPRDITCRYEKISIGPLSYHADQVVSYIAWLVKKKVFSGPIPA